MLDDAVDKGYFHSFDAHDQARVNLSREAQAGAKAARAKMGDYYTRPIKGSNVYVLALRELLIS